MKHAAFGWLAAGFFGALASPMAIAGAKSPCDTPTLFRDAGVQVLILPYESERQLSPQAAALATLMQRHVLFAALKYRSIAVTELTERDGPCRPDLLISKVIGALKPGQFAIVLSGQLFEQRDRIHLKSIVTVLAGAGMAKPLVWPLGGDPPVALSTRLPSTIAGFAPRTIPLEYLERMRSAQQRARRVHREPDAGSPARELPTDPDAQFVFHVLDARDDWMKIRVQPYDIEGWIPAHALATADQLKGEFPELYFVDGLVGYHGIARDPVRAARLARESFARYLSVSGQSGESEPRALAAVMQGNSWLLGSTGQWSDDTLKMAQRDYLRALELMPGSLVAANHELACTTLLCARDACGEDAASLHNRYLAALALDPTNPELLLNLDQYYAAAQSQRVKTPLSGADLTQQQQILRQAIRRAGEP